MHYLKLYWFYWRINVCFLFIIVRYLHFRLFYGAAFWDIFTFSKAHNDGHCWCWCEGILSPIVLPFPNTYILEILCCIYNQKKNSFEKNSRPSAKMIILYHWIDYFGLIKLHLWRASDYSIYYIQYWKASFKKFKTKVKKKMLGAGMWICCYHEWGR